MEYRFYGCELPSSSYDYLDSIPYTLPHNELLPRVRAAVMSFYKRLPIEVRYMVFDLLLSRAILPLERMETITALVLDLSDEVSTDISAYTAAVQLAFIELPKNYQIKWLNSFLENMCWDKVRDYLENDNFEQYFQIVLRLIFDRAGYATDPVIHGDINYMLTRHAEWLHNRHYEAIRKSEAWQIMDGPAAKVHHHEDWEDLMQDVLFIRQQLSALEEDLDIEVGVTDFLLLMGQLCTWVDGARTCEWQWRAPPW